MPKLVLDNVPQNLLDRLAREAAAENQSLQEAALRVLAHNLDRAEEGRITAVPAPRSRTQVLAMLEEVRRTRYPLAPGTPDSVDLLREDRAR